MRGLSLEAAWKEVQRNPAIWVDGRWQMFGSIMQDRVVCAVKDEMASVYESNQI